MMGRRRGGDRADSLDLFLDTICNAFGGLLFLAILLTLLVQMRSNDDSASAREVISEVELERLALEIETAERRREELSRQVYKLSQFVDEMKGSPLEQQASKVEELQKKIEPLLSQVKSESQLVESILREIRGIQEQMANLDVELPVAREALAEAREKLTASLVSRQESVEAPVERMTLKSPICLLMRYNRVYLVFSDVRNQTVNLGHVQEIASAKGVIVQPRQGQGWDLTSGAGIERVRELLASASPLDRFFSIGVWPDSYGNFEKIKQPMIERGFSYQLIPLTTEERISYGVSDEASLVQ